MAMFTPELPAHKPQTPFNLYRWAVPCGLLFPVMKAMDPGAVAFRDQFRFGIEPVLHIASGERGLCSHK